MSADSVNDNVPMTFVKSTYDNYDDDDDDDDDDEKTPIATIAAVQLTIAVKSEVKKCLKLKKYEIVRLLLQYRKFERPVSVWSIFYRAA